MMLTFEDSFWKNLWRAPHNSGRQLLCAAHWLLREGQGEVESPPAATPCAQRHLSQPSQLRDIPTSDTGCGRLTAHHPMQLHVPPQSYQPGQGLCWVGRALAIGSPLPTQPTELCCKRKPPQSRSDGGKKDISKCLPTWYDNICTSHWDLELPHLQANKGAVNPFSPSHR